MSSYLDQYLIKNSTLIKELGNNLNQNNFPQKFNQLSVYNYKFRNNQSLLCFFIPDIEHFNLVLECLRFFMVDELPIEVYTYLSWNNIFNEDIVEIISNYKDYHYREMMLILSVNVDGELTRLDTLLRLSAIRGHFNLFRYLFEQNHETYQTRDIYKNISYHAYEGLKLEGLKYVHSKGAPFDIDGNTAYLACERNDIETLKYLHHEKYDLSDIDYVEGVLCGTGLGKNPIALECLIFVCETMEEIIWIPNMYSAVETHNIEILKYCHKNLMRTSHEYYKDYPNRLLENMFIWHSSEDHETEIDQCIDYVINVIGDKLTKEAHYDACKYGNPIAIKHLYENVILQLPPNMSKEECENIIGTDIIAWCARHGRFDCLEFVFNSYIKNNSKLKELQPNFYCNFNEETMIDICNVGNSVRDNKERARCFKFLVDNNCPFNKEECIKACNKVQFPETNKYILDYLNSL